jgi:hypothetical protein
MSYNVKCDICEKTPAYNYHQTGKYFCDAHTYEMRTYGEIRGRNIRTKNEIVILDDYAEIILYNRKQEEVARAKIDKEDIFKASKYKWRYTHGYANNRMSGISLQNLIMNFVPSKQFMIDHINRNRLDCRKINLRISDYTTNGFNKGKQSNNKSGFPGVFFNNTLGKWQANIKYHRKNIVIGHYNNIEDAIKDRIEAEIEYFGEKINRENDINTVFKKDE